MFLSSFRLILIDAEWTLMLDVFLDLHNVLLIIEVSTLLLTLGRLVCAVNPHGILD